MRRATGGGRVGQKRGMMMAASNESTDWHLTPRGWERGTQKMDHGTEEREPPTDRVWTVRFQESYSSIYSSPRRASKDSWRSSDNGKIGELLKQHGSAPQHL